MAQTDTTGLAHCENDETALRKMREELDAAAEFIGILSDQLDQARQMPGTPAEEHLDPRERADRAALLQIVYHLADDNPGLSLDDALVYLSSVFGGVQTTESSTPLEVEAESSPPDFHEDPAILPAVTVAPEDPAPAEMEATDHFEQLIAQAQQEQWIDETNTATNEQPLPSFEDLLPPPMDPLPTQEPDESIQEIIPLPQPMSAAQALGEQTPPAPAEVEPTDDNTWDPLKYAGGPSQTKQLDELLKQVEVDRDDEIYGIKAFAKEHPELFETPKKVPKQVLKKKK